MWWSIGKRHVLRRWRQNSGTNVTFLKRWHYWTWTSMFLILKKWKIQRNTMWRSIGKRSTFQNLRYILYLNFDVKRFEKYSFPYRTSHINKLKSKLRSKIGNTKRTSSGSSHSTAIEEFNDTFGINSSETFLFSVALFIFFYTASYIVYFIYF